MKYIFVSQRLRETSASGQRPLGEKFALLAGRPVQFNPPQCAATHVSRIQYESAKMGHLPISFPDGRTATKESIIRSASGFLFAIAFLGSFLAHPKKKESRTEPTLPHAPTFWLAMKGNRI